MISRTRSVGIFITWPISSGVGSRPSSWRSWREIRINLLIVSTMWTGMRMVRAWSASARVMACRIHQVAYVLNLYPLRQSNFSTARISPRFPSWIRSRNSMPRPTYFFAMLTTRRRLASIRRRFASSSPRSIRLASLISSAELSSGTLPISLRYIRTGSSMLTPSRGSSTASAPDVVCPLRGLGTDIQLPVEVLELHLQGLHALPVPGSVRVPKGLQQPIHTLLQPDSLDPPHAPLSCPEGIFRMWFGNQKSAQERDRRLVP